MNAPASSFIAAAINFVTASGWGDVYLVAGGVFLGTIAAAIVIGAVRWSMSRGRNAELERLIVRALAEHEKQQQRRRDEETLRAAG